MPHIVTQGVTGAAIPKDAYQFGARTSGEIHGVVLTKPHVVDLILDLAGYSVRRNLTRLRLLEPACGHGAFLVPAVRRLLAVSRRQMGSLGDLSMAIRAYDVDPEHVAIARQAVAHAVAGEGVPSKVANDLAARWIRQGDFLLENDGGPFDAVVGNPPYIRIEQLPGVLQHEYRRRFSSLFDRADLYVAFIEHGLSQLGDEGILSFICADRWTLNRYGAPLRRLIADRFHVRNYIDLHQASPFESEVIAYPAIFAIGRKPAGQVRVAVLGSASPQECKAAIRAMNRPDTAPAGIIATEYKKWFRGDEPWVLIPPEQLSLLRQLEERYDVIETHETKVRIGVATGNDKVYIVGADVDVEPDRLVPIVMREDIEAGRIRAAQRFVINTFETGGGVVDLHTYPRLAKYFQRHGDTIRARHVSQKNPGSWFRTIDRVYPELVGTPKLLIPDIAGSNEVVLDEGRFHPHHNLYFVTSSSWDLRVLGALLSSKVALFFVWCYAVKMRGGYLRFQAQYLRRIRLPKAEKIEPALAKALATAFDARDFARIDALALQAYDIEALPPFEFVDTRT